MSSRVKILRVIARLNVGGPARHTTVLSDALVDHGFETVLVFGSCGPDEASMEHLLTGSRARTHRIPELGRSVRPLDDLKAFVALVGLIWRERPAIVHTHTAKAGTLGRLAAALCNLARRRERRALIVHTFHGHVLHGYFSPTISTLVRWIERGLAGLTDVIVCISPTQRDDLVHRFRVATNGQAAVVPLGLDLDTLLADVETRENARHRLGISPSAFVVAFVGRLVPIKDVPTLLRAMAEVARQVPEALLMVAGDGDQRASIEALAQEIGLTPRVMWLGWRQDLAALYAAADVVALSSRNEGTPVTLIEGMAAGRPVVSTNVGGVADVVTHEVTGLLVPVGEHRDMAAALTQLAHNPAEALRMGQRGREDVRARYGVARLVSDVEALYRARLAAPTLARDDGSGGRDA